MKKLIFLFLFASIAAFAQVPNPPTLLLPLDNSNVNIDSVLLDWSDVPGALSYRVQVNTGPLTILDEPGIILSQYLIPSVYLTSNTIYYWRVNVTTSGGTSSWSSFYHFTTNPPGLNPPVLINPVNNQTGVSINPTFLWNAVPGVTAYILHVSKLPLFDSLVVCDTTPLATVTLEYNTHYYWRMCAKNSGVIGPWSTVFNFYTMVQVPDPPVLLTPADSSTIPLLGQVFDWNESVGAISYRIQISNSPTFGTTVLNQVTGSASQYTVSSSIFTNNTIYYWRVNATNMSGTGGWSNVWRVVTMGSLPPPPSISYINNGGPVYCDSNICINWSKVLTATSYRIQVSTSVSFTTTIINAVVNDTFYVIPPNTLNQYTIYYYRIASINNNGQGSWTTAWILRPIHSPLSPPALLYPVDSAVNVPVNPTFDWSDVGGAINYRLQISTVQNFSSVLFSVSGLTNSGYTLSSGILTTCTKFYWRVKAFITGDSSQWSAVRSFTTTCPPGVKRISTEIPTEYKLYNNYPNPFNPSTNIRYQITNNKFTTLKIFDILGREVKTLVSEFQKTGTYEIKFSLDGFENGVYFYRLQSGGFIDTKKMLMIK